MWSSTERNREDRPEDPRASRKRPSAVYPFREAADLASGASLVIVAGVATVTFVVVGVAACGVALLRAIGRIGRAAQRNMPFQDRTTIEGVVVDSTDVSPQSLRTDGDAR
jgi:hypothetical protein